MSVRRLAPLVALAVGQSFVSSLVPEFPGDQSPYATRANIRTGHSGDPVLAWDNQGRLFAGSESSDDPNGSAKIRQWFFGSLRLWRRPRRFRREPTRGQIRDG